MRGSADGRDRRRALEDAPEAYAGCAVIISHDRMFLDRMATHMLAFEGDANAKWFEGNFEEYEKTRSAGSAPIASIRKG